MKTLALLSMPTLLLGFFLWSKVPSTSVPESPSTPLLSAKILPTDETPSTGFAVVELFTSEGCSSCPPADKFLNELVDDALESGKAVYPLAFHVDYWDRLGWKDPFSSGAYSDRQRSYARQMNLSSIYTPQMIVNGRSEFVGSDREKGEKEIEKALQEKDNLSVKFDVEKMKDGALQVSYHLGDGEAIAREKLLLHLALVEKGITTDVKRGENGGKTLRHENVVRSFVTITPNGSGSGTANLTVPDGIQLDKSGVIAYVQDAGSLKVLGAGKGTIQK